MTGLVSYKISRQVEQLYSNLGLIAVGSMMSSLFAAAIIYHQSASNEVLVWLVFMLVVGFLRICVLITFKKKAEKSESLKGAHWLYIFKLGVFLTNLGAGAAVFAFFDPFNIQSSVIVFTLYIAFIASNASSNSCRLNIVLLGIIPSTMLVLARLLLEGDIGYTLLAISILYFAVSLVKYSHSLSKTFSKNVEMELEKLEFIRELQVQKGAVERSMQEKTNFFASASHDLRQPLHALGLYQEALSCRLSDPMNLDVMNKISHSTKVLAEMLDTMLDISRLDANAVEEKQKNVFLYDDLQALFTEFNTLAESKGVKLIVDVPKGLTCFLDQTFLERVVRNLIDNAIKYTNLGVVLVSARKAIESDMVELVVSDTGIGIPDDKVDEIFMEFSQLNNPGRDRKKGVGLGLSIVKRLCDLMNVEIKFSSVHGEGTRVSLLLPMSVA